MVLLDVMFINALNEPHSPNARFGEHDHLQAAERRVERRSFGS